MCLFVTATLPRTADHIALDQIARAHGRQFRSQANESIAIQLGKDFAYFVTTVRMCDCDTGLGSARALLPRTEADWARVKRGYVRKGWSRAKVERVLAQMREQESDPSKQSRRVDENDLARWQALIEAVLGSGLTKELGLLLHWYSGSLDERIELRGQEQLSSADSATELRRMQQDVLYVFRK